MWLPFWTWAFANRCFRQTSLILWSHKWTFVTAASYEASVAAHVPTSYKDIGVAKRNES